MVRIGPGCKLCGREPAEAGVRAAPIVVVATLGDSPPENFKRIATAAEHALKDPELQRSCAAGGFEVANESSPALLRRFLANEIEQWRSIVDTVGFKFN